MRTASADSIRRFLRTEQDVDASRSHRGGNRERSYLRQVGAEIQSCQRRWRPTARVHVTTAICQNQTVRRRPGVHRNRCRSIRPGVAIGPNWEHGVRFPGPEAAVYLHSICARDKHVKSRHLTSIPVVVGCLQGSSRLHDVARSRSKTSSAVGRRFHTQEKSGETPLSPGRDLIFHPRRNTAS